MLPDPAAAWGPVSHLAQGSQVLRNLTILGLGLQRILRPHSLEYLYGCVGADITLAKKYTRSVHAHCHFWPVGWQLLEAASSDRQRAFAWGYLSHLAADVYAHNHFVPTQLVLTFRTRALQHLYWEARFDSMQRPQHHRLIHSLREQTFPDCDELMERVVERTLFSFRTDKRVFDSVLALHDWTNWRRLMARIAATSGYDLRVGLVDRYNAVSRASILDVLQHGQTARCQTEDPTGSAAIALALDLRAALKALQRRGVMTPEITGQLAALDARADLTPQAATTGFAAALGSGGAPD